ncbi:hypothetical protein [Helicobacter burdigaliensis]|nr:hypothetical protein [Helicobacter burdigaliensis]
MKAFSLLEALIVLFVFGIFIGVFGSSFLEIQKFKILEDRSYFLTLQTKTSLQILKNYLRMGLLEDMKFTPNFVEFWIPLYDFTFLEGYSYPCFSGFLENIKFKNHKLEAKPLVFSSTLGQNICNTLFKKAKYAILFFGDEKQQNIDKNAVVAEIVALDFGYIVLDLPAFILSVIKNGEKVKIYPKIYLLKSDSKAKIFLKENALFMQSSEGLEILAKDILSFNITKHKLGFVISLCAKDSFDKNQKLCLSDILLFEEFSYVF